MRSVDPSTSDPIAVARPVESRSSEVSLAARFARIGVAGALVAGLVVSGAPLCPIAYVTGFPCPGCGLTRAALCLGRGDVLGAFASSPLSPVVVPFFAFLVARSVALYLKGRDASPPPWITRGAIGLWAALIVVWGLRFSGLFGGPVAVRSVWG